LSDHENDHGDIRYKYLQIGVVVARNDPMGLARVRVRIPGLIEVQSGWCFPLGAPGGGTAQRGMKFVPRMGAEVGILFKGGDPDCPYYMPAQWGAPGGVAETPITGENYPTSSAPLDPSEMPEDVDVIETERYEITIDNRPTHETLRFKDKINGDMIEMDGTKATGPGITIYGTAAVYLKSDGIVVIDSLSCEINGRAVADGSQPI
jgi:hypothetical protein